MPVQFVAPEEDPACTESAGIVVRFGYGRHGSRFQNQYLCQSIRFPRFDFGTKPPFSLTTPDPSFSKLLAWLDFPTGERVELDALCSIGRNPRSQVVIDSERVSRRHAVIRRAKDGTYELLDMGSSNGTYLNGRKIERPAALSDGQIIEIGLVKMTFRATSSAGGADQVTMTTAECWVLVIEAALRGARTPNEHFSDKTVESWNERCHRVIVKRLGTPVRALREGLLAYWRNLPGENSAANLAAALRSLRLVQKETEEFRFAVHFGPITFKEGGPGGSKPVGDAMIYTLELQRLVGAVDTLVLISEPAYSRLRDILPMRRLSSQEMRNRGGSETFYTLREEGEPPLRQGEIGERES